MELTGIRELSFSEGGCVRFKADDKLRGETDVLLSDPRDVKALAEFLFDMVTVMQSGESPEECGYLRIA